MISNKTLIKLLSGDVICYDESGAACKLDKVAKNHLINLLEMEDLAWKEYEEACCDSGRGMEN